MGGDGGSSDGSVECSNSSDGSEVGDSKDIVVIPFVHSSVKLSQACNTPCIDVFCFAIDCPVLNCSYGQSTLSIVDLKLVNGEETQGFLL